MQIPVRIPLLPVKDFLKKYALKWNGRLKMCITGLAIIYGRQVVYIYLQELTEYSNQAEFFFRFPVMLILPFLKNFSMPLSFWMGIERLLLRGRKGSIKGGLLDPFVFSLKARQLGYERKIRKISIGIEKKGEFHHYNILGKEKSQQLNFRHMMPLQTFAACQQELLCYHRLSD